MCNALHSSLTSASLHQCTRRHCRFCRRQSKSQSIVSFSLSFTTKMVHQIERAWCTTHWTNEPILTSVRMNVRIFLSTRVMCFFSHPIVFYGDRRCENRRRCSLLVFICALCTVQCALTDKTRKSEKSKNGEEKKRRRRKVHLKKKTERPIKAFFWTRKHAPTISHYQQLAWTSWRNRNAKRMPNAHTA